MSVRDARTFAVGDLHGEITLLRYLLEEIQLTPNDTLVLLGDQVDRGEDSVATIELVASLADRCHLILIQGNHDQAWLEVWTGSGYSERPNIPGARAIWDQYQGQPPLIIGEVLSATVLTYEDAFAFYSHAGATVGKPFAEAWAETWVWGEPDFLDDYPWSWGKPVVFGHYEVNPPLVTETKICLDTAAYRTGVLTAMRMNDRTLLQVCRDGSVRWGAPT